MKILLLILTALFFSACAKQSIMPDKDEINVSRKAPDKDCTELGKVSGTSDKIKPHRQDVLNDMKQDAANKGANYLVVKQYSDSGTSVTGIAYQCP